MCTQLLLIGGKTDGYFSKRGLFSLNAPHALLNYFRSDSLAVNKRQYDNEP